MKWFIIGHADKKQGDFYILDMRHQDQPINEKGHLKAQKLI
ncbi:MAG: hypothetical protein ACFFG0_43880 [Candidatus Thorarchaeota archaeon]